MTDSPVIQPKETKQTLLVVWAIGATLLALVSTGVSVFLSIQARQRSNSQTPAVSASPFLDLPESQVPGSYKWVSKTGESHILLNADHTFVKDGNPNPAHRWEITRDALVLYWLRSQTRFNKIEKPGVYVELMDGAETARIEKQE